MIDTNGPARPRGEPKPLLEEDISSVLARLDAWYASHLPADEYRFNPPATQVQLEAFEQLVGIRMPGAYHQLYLWHDGEDDGRSGHIYGLPLLSLSQACREWELWNDVLADFGGNRYEISAAAWPEGAVDPAYINPRWIPLTHDSSGNHIGLDFDPWPEGRIGQVILYGGDEGVKVVLAQSLGGFLQLLAALLEGGNFRLESEASGWHEFNLKMPPLDHFHDGIRELLGAPAFNIE